MAKKGVSIAKKILTKANQTNQDPYIFLLEYRNTPLECGFTPVQLLTGRRIKSVVPITNALLKPKTVNPELVKNKIEMSKSRQKSYFDRNTRSLEPLYVNDSVRVQFGKQWIPGKIISKQGERSYNVQTKSGKIYRRNRKCLIKSHEQSFEFYPNILLNPTDSGVSDYANSHEHTCPSSRPLPTNLENAPYTTRSGRIVKPSTRYQSDHYVLRK